MAHQLTLGANGLYEMAYAGAKPWHGLGQELSEDAGIDQWIIDAGFNWSILSSKVQFMNGSMHYFDNNNVLYRSDNNKPLHIVANGYKIVQPREVMEFFRKLVEVDGFKLETAGTLDGGKRFWALADTGFDAEIVKGDKVKSKLLVATSCDQSISTLVGFTSVRVVCNNTLHMAIKNNEFIKIRHNTKFDEDIVKMKLGLDANQEFSKFIDRMKTAADISLTESRAKEIVEHLFARSVKFNPSESNGFKTVMALFNGVGKGANLQGVKGTGWGLINAVTEYVDFKTRARDQNNRLNSAWFGKGAQLKRDAVKHVLEY